MGALATNDGGDFVVPGATQFGRCVDVDVYNRTLSPASVVFGSPDVYM